MLTRSHWIAIGISGRSKAIQRTGRAADLSQGSNYVIPFCRDLKTDGFVDRRYWVQPSKASLFQIATVMVERDDGRSEISGFVSGMASDSTRIECVKKFVSKVMVAAGGVHG